MPDVGLTHVALAVTNLQKSVEFYQRYARMRIVHERADVAWLSDETRPFVIVLVAALPSASNVSLLAERFGADNGRVARIILVSTAAAFVTFSVAVALLR